MSIMYNGYEVSILGEENVQELDTTAEYLDLLTAFNTTESAP